MKESRMTTYTYNLQLIDKKHVRPFIQGQVQQGPFSWAAGDQVCFTAPDGFRMRVKFTGDFPLGAELIENNTPRTVAKLSAGNHFVASCTLIDAKTGELYGWEKTGDQTSGNDGNVHT